MDAFVPAFVKWTFTAKMLGKALANKRDRRAANADSYCVNINAPRSVAHSIPILVELFDDHCCESVMSRRTAYFRLSLKLMDSANIVQVSRVKIVVLMFWLVLVVVNFHSELGHIEHSQTLVHS
jgi:hypothetical protein